VACEREEGKSERKKSKKRKRDNDTSGVGKGIKKERKKRAVSDEVGAMTSSTDRSTPGDAACVKPKANGKEKKRRTRAEEPTGPEATDFEKKDRVDNKKKKKRRKEKNAMEDRTEVADSTEQPNQLSAPHADDRALLKALKKAERTARKAKARKEKGKLK
jgi:hypothetical protein